jgi:hypothetical protein
METRFAASTRRSTKPQVSSAESEDAAQRLKALVSRGWKLDAEIGLLQERLAEIKGQLVQEAKKGNRKGETVEFQGLEVGHKVSVSLPEDSLVRSFWFEGEEAVTYVNDEKTVLGKLKEFCGEHFKKLFLESFKPKSKVIRDLAVGFLGKDKGTRLIEKLTFPSAPRVSFKSK